MITASTTTITTLQPTTLVCIQPAPVEGAQCIDGQWVVDTDLSVTNNYVSINTTTVVTGNLNVSGGTVNLGHGSQLNVTGCVSFTRSTLVVNLDPSINSRTNYTALSYGCLDPNSEFSSIKVESNQGCKKATISQTDYQTNRLVLLISVQNECGLATWVIIVVVVAVAVAVVVLAVIIKCYLNKRRRFSNHAVALQNRA